MSIRGGFCNLIIVYCFYLYKVSALEAFGNIPEGVSQSAINIVQNAEFRGLFAGNGFLANAVNTALDNSTLYKAKVKQTTSEQCQSDLNLFLKGLSNQELWALRMADSAGKVPSGVFYGNWRWMGNFDECQSVQHQRSASQDDGMLNGKYCHYGIQTVPPTVDMLFRRFVIGVCVPETCTEDDVVFLAQNFIRKNVDSFLPGNLTLTPTNMVCQERKVELDNKAIGVLIFLGFYGMFMVVATLFDIIIHWKSGDKKPLKDVMHFNEIKKEGHGNGVVENEKTEKSQLVENGTRKEKNGKKDQRGMGAQLLLCFSILENTKKLINTDNDTGEFPSLHGIRFFSISWVIIGHAFMYSSQLSSNIVVTFPIFKKRLTAAAVFNATISVDSFFALSGFLVAYILLTELKKRKGKMNWPVFFFHRFWRLTPSYMLFIMVYVTLTKYVQDGPMWPQKEGFEYNDCAGSWWRNILYINNFAEDPKDKCVMWSWYMANDMQLYLFSPLLILPLYYSMKKGMIWIFIVLMVSWITSGIIATKYELPIVYGFKPRDENVPSPWTLYYEKPYCRIGPYLMGIVTGYIMFKIDGRIKMSRKFNLFCWSVATVLACVVLYGTHDAFNGVELSQGAISLYIATHRTLWGACVCWVIFACSTGYGGFVNSILTMKALIPLSRLTFFAYLCNPVIELICLLAMRDSMYALDIELVYHLTSTLVTTFMVASVMSISFESPLLAVEKILMKRFVHKK